MRLGDPQRLRVTGAVRGHARLEHHHPAAHLDHPDRVRIPVRINTNDEVQLLSGAGLGMKAADGRTVTGHARNGRTGF